MKLRTKFSILTCSLTIIVVLGVSVFLYIAEKQLLLNEMEENQENVVNGLSEVGKESLITSNEILTINYVNKIKATKGVEYAMLTMPSGEISAHTDVNLLGNRIQPPLKVTDDVLNAPFTQAYSHGEEEFSVISHPVIIDGKPGGIAWVAFSQTVINNLIDDTLKKTRKRIIGVASVGLLMGVIGAIILSIMMTKPIKKMAAGARLIGQGKLDTKIEVDSRDELGDLAGDLNLMAEKLAELDQMKQDFVSSITHEFRSPLNAMGIHFDLLSKGNLGELNEKQLESLDILKKNASRLGVFIDDLLDVAKLERGKMVINSSLFDLGTVIKETRDFYRVQAEKKVISLEAEYAQDLPQVYADPDRTRQILTNLLNNAIKFTPEKGSINIEAKTIKDDLIEVAVRDSGMGIPEDQVDSIFNKFEQVKGVRQKIGGQKGTGLGLAIVKGLVEGQGGDIRVESEYGKGTVFFFTIPVRRNTPDE